MNEQEVMSDQLWEEVEQRVPKQCPFCWASDEVVWREFEVAAAEAVYVDREKNEMHRTGRNIIRVTCTRCDEEILEGDI